MCAMLWHVTECGHEMWYRAPNRVLLLVPTTNVHRSFVGHLAACVRYCVPWNRVWFVARVCVAVRCCGAETIDFAICTVRAIVGTEQWAWNNIAKLLATFHITEILLLLRKMMPHNAIHATADDKGRLWCKRSSWYCGRRWKGQCTEKPETNFSSLSIFQSEVPQWEGQPSLCQMQSLRFGTNLRKHNQHAQPPSLQAWHGLPAKLGLWQKGKLTYFLSCNVLFCH